MARRDTAMIGATGEHYVMWRLLRRGHIAALAPRNAVSADILICDSSGARLAAVQVKTAGETVKVGWQMHQRHETLRADTLFYCFVDLGARETDTPSCWIVPSAVVAEHVTLTHQAWLAGAPKRGQARQDSTKRTMHLACRERTLTGYPAGWMDP